MAKGNRKTGAAKRAAGRKGGNATKHKWENTGRPGVYGRHRDYYAAIGSHGGFISRPPTG